MDGFQDRRTEQRIDTKIDLECLIAGQPVDAVLRNLSAGGAMLEVARGNASSGDIVLLKILGLTSLIGRVCWKERSMVGFEFKTRLHPSIIRYLGFPDDGPDFEDMQPQRVA